MTKQLKISDDLSLPIDFVTERIAFLARTGAGKSGGMRVLFEAFLDTDQFAIFVDPKGDAWGVRAAGVGPGYPVLVMGGDHGDVPLEATAGKVIAEFLVRERVSTVLDISDFGKADMVRFVTELASTLYRRNREVVHVFLDEADMVAGEKFYDPKCLEAIQLIQNKGRHRGFGVTVATQRSAMINKTVLYASGTLVAMQTTSPKDIKTVRDWLEVVATPDAAKEIVSALPTLKTREALIYSPQYLGGEAVKLTFKTFRTFDSMRTPKPGETRQQPKSLADIDLSIIERDMAATIEHAKANDPALLKKEIADLKRKLTSNQPDPKAVERQINAGIQSYVDESRRVQAENAKLFNDLRGRLEKIAQLAQLNGNAPAIAEYKPVVPKVVIDRPSPPPRVVQRRVTQDASTGLQAAEKAFLSVLAQRTGKPTTRNQLAVLAGYSAKSRHVDNVLSALRTKGFVDGRGDIFITDSGIDALGEFSPLPTGRDLLNYWLQKLDAAPSAMLRALSEAYPNTLTRNEVAERAGYSVTSRHVDNCLSTLRTRELIEGRGELRASEELFD